MQFLQKYFIRKCDESAKTILNLATSLPKISFDTVLPIFPLL
jgi:hypothetical protein